MDVRSNAELGCNLPLHEEKNESHNPNRPQSAAKSSSAPNAARQIKAQVGPVNLPKKNAVARTKQSMPIASRTHRAIATPRGCGSSGISGTMTLQPNVWVSGVCVRLNPMVRRLYHFSLVYFRSGLLIITHSVSGTFRCRLAGSGSIATGSPIQPHLSQTGRS